MNEQLICSGGGFIHPDEDDADSGAATVARPEIKHSVQFYCPACGGTSSMLLSSPYQVAPGDGFFKCPLCDTLFSIGVEFVPLGGDAPHIPMNDDGTVDYRAMGVCMVPPEEE